MKHRFWLAISTLVLLLGCSSTTTSPTVSLQADPDIIAPGQSSQLRWQVSGSEPITLRLTPEVEETLTSPLTVSPSETTTYTLTASNSAGSNSASVTITVTDEPTISAFEATPAEGTVPLEVTFNWTLNVATGCTFDPGDGSDMQTFDDCPTNQQTTHTYDQAGTYDARLTLENGNTQTTSVTVLPADDSVSVGGFVAEQSRNVVVILTDEGQQAVTLDSLNRAIATVTTSLGAEDTPSVRGANAALLGLLSQQDNPTDEEDSQQVTETEQLFSLVGDFVVAVDSRGQVVGSSQLTTTDTNSVRFDLDIAADTTVALLLASDDGRGGWFCKGSLEYQVVENQQTTSSQQTLYRFPASLINNSSLQAGRFVFNELTGQPAALLEGDTSSMIGDVPEDAVLDALITPEDAPAFADGVYRLCANENALQTNVLADLNWQSDAFTQDTFTEDAFAEEVSTLAESTVYDYALALVIGEQNGQRRLLGSAPINPDGTLRVPLTYAGSINAQLIMTDVAFFDADKQQFPLTPSYAFDEDVQTTGEATETDIDLRQQGGGLAYISGNVITSSGQVVAGATVIMVVDGERLAFNVATADENGFFELLIPVSDDAYVLYAQNPEATLGGVASNDNTGVRYVVNDDASINQDITLNIPINAGSDPSTRPEVSAGSDLVVIVNRPVRVQGNASDPDGDTLSLRWEILTQPAGSDLTLSDADNNADSDAVTFTPEHVGDYVLRLTASDGRTLAADLVTVRVLPDGTSSVSSVQFVNAPSFTELREGGEGYTLELSRSGAANEPLTVRLQLAEDNISEPDEIRLEGATASGSDYLVTFDAGQVRTTVTVFALEDDTPESSDLLVLELVGGDNYNINNANQASFILLDAGDPVDPIDPPPPSPRCEGLFVVRQAADFANLERCQIITGDLIIDPLEPLSLQQTSDITSLAPLANLQTILGTLIIRNTALETFTGLNLQQIGGNLILENNAVLTNLSAIAALTDDNVAGNVTISDNSSLDCPAQNLTFTVDVSTGNLVDCNQPAITAPVIASFTATPNVLDAGQNSVLEWTITGTAPVTLTLEGGATTQNVSNQTSLTVNPTVTTNYILTASNSAGEDSATLIVTVNPTAETCEGDYLITSQADLQVLETCTVITGNLVLQDTTITDLAPLANLTNIGGSLILNNNDSLTSLAGLDNLTNVGGSVDIDDNNLVTSLEPLSNLQTIGGFLDIGNTALTDLTGLGALESIGGELFINQNEQMTSLTGLDSLVSIGGYLEITGNPQLISVNGLESLTSISGGIYIGFDAASGGIDGNATLTDLSTLADLTDADIAGVERFVTGNVALDCPAQNLDFTVTASEGNLVDCAVPTDVCPGDVTVTNQADLDDLASCSEITGNLTITGSEDIVTLDALDNLTTIGGTLEILENPSLTSTAGLENLTSLGGDLRLNINNALMSLEGFAGLETVGELYIGLNNDLTNLSGLENLTSVSRIDIIGNGVLEDITTLENITSPVSRLIIQENANLTDLTGLGSITTVTDDVLILGNGALTNLSGLAVTDIGNILELRGNPVLTDLEGLENLVSIGNDIQITNNDALTSLVALSDLTSVGDSILVQENATLPNLNGLQNITDYDDTNTVNIINNPQLDCSQPTPTPTLPFEVDVDAGNLVNCNAVVVTTCTGDYTVTSQAELDALANCEVITGNLVLDSGSGITNLNALSNITTIGGDFEIRDEAAIGDLDALSNLATLGGNLTLRNSTSLDDLIGLSNLTNFTGDLTIDNIGATDLTGLGGITTPNDVTLISGVLTSLAGLSITDIAGNLTLTTIPNVTDFTSLTSLTSIGGNLQLENLDFADLSFLTNLTSVGGDITIFNNDRASFTSLAGIENIAGYNDANTVTINDNGFLDCNALLPLPFVVDVSTDNAVECGAPVVCTGDYTVTNQTELDALALCNEITGNLVIDGSTDIANLDVLTNLTTLGGKLEIRDNTILANVGGLANLTSFGGLNLRIENNDALISLNGLGGITNVFNFNIRDNLLLPDLTGLENLTTVTGAFDIFNNDALSSLAALANVTSVTAGQIIITDNPNLPNLTGLDGITSAPADLLIQNNANLTTLAGLAVTDIGGGLVITNNALLNDISALAGLNSISGAFGGASLAISTNDALTSIAPLALSLTTVTNDIEITDNATLANLDGLQNIAAYDDAANTVTVSNNAVLDCSQPASTPTLLFTVDTSIGNDVDCP